jgi:tRNA(His) guanylyltransferase
MHDALGERIKGQYELRTRYFLPRRTYTLIRLDGKAFHTYTRGLKKPFDLGLFEDIDNAIIALLPHLQGAAFAYTQSDEISVLLTDFSTTGTSAWFDGNVQKMASVSASILTAEFNRLRARRWSAERKAIQASAFVAANGMDEEAADNTDFDVSGADSFKLAYFDSRVFTVPDRIEVMNYFIWRNQDCSRNSVSMVAQANFSHKELHGKSTPAMHDMLHAKGVNWATDYGDGEKNGRLIIKETVRIQPAEAIEKNAQLGFERSKWVSKSAWKFTEDKDRLLAMIPQYESSLVQE